MSSKPIEYFPPGSGNMSSSTSGSDAFLEELQSKGIGFEGFHTDDAESRVIASLSDGKSKDIAQIMHDSGCLPLGALLQAIESLQQFGLLTGLEEAGQKIFQLSPSGIKTSDMMGLWSGAR